ncbi:hypothetical protein niasHT_029826 [Heterodera trifolii]|uniref:Uncharacterized protein n=1 Tax=Heterodera trifolii TaxID=157864 RepID=A0ABD2K0P9_9BILA
MLRLPHPPPRARPGSYAIEEALFKKPAEQFAHCRRCLRPPRVRASFCFYMFHHHHHGTRPAVPGSCKQKWQLGEVALIVVLHLLSPSSASPNVMVCVPSICVRQTRL